MLIIVVMGSANNEDRVQEQAALRDLDA